MSFKRKQYSPPNTFSSSSPHYSNSRTKNKKPRSGAENRNKSNTSHDNTEVQNDQDFTNWPAPLEKIEQAREFIKDCARNNHLTLIVPDKDGM